MQKCLFPASSLHYCQRALTSNSRSSFLEFRFLSGTYSTWENPSRHNISAYIRSTGTSDAVERRIADDVMQLHSMGVSVIRRAQGRRSRSAKRIEDMNA